MNEIRVLVVDDSAVVRRVIGDIIKSEPGMSLAGTAVDGADGLEKIKELKPDLVTLDLEMPVMGGLDVLSALRKQRSQVPVIVVSSLTLKGSAPTLEALARGASDYVSKPTSSGDPRTPRSDIRGELVPRILALGSRRGPVSRPSTGSTRPAPTRPATRTGSGTRPTSSISPSERLRQSRQERPSSGGSASGVSATEGRPRTGRDGREATTRQAKPVLPSQARSQRQPTTRARPAILPPKAVVIGSSTGGPAALEQVFSAIRTPLNVPMFIVQHIPAEFSAMLAKRLHAASAMTVVEAIAGQTPEPGTVYVAPGGRHMVLKKNKRRVIIELTDTPPVNSCRPAVDVLFQSSAEVYGANQLAVILTGMGQDGLDGCRTLFPLGVPIIAQDEETCVVWGMPRFVAEEGLADEIVPLPDVAGRIVARVTGKGVLSGARVPVATA